MPEVSRDLERFVRAQQRTYETALAEIRGGRKRSHWMWYVFPQIAGLGFSEKSRRYAIRERWNWWRAGEGRCASRCRYSLYRVGQNRMTSREK